MFSNYFKYFSIFYFGFNVNVVEFLEKPYPTLFPEESNP